MDTNSSLRTIALTLTLLLILSACGGGSGGGNPASTPDDNPTIDIEGGGLTEQPSGTPIASGDYFCPSHITTDNTVIGNNVYQFKAGEGQCFGTIDDLSLVKRTVPVVAQPRNRSPAGFASFSADAKLTTNATSLIPGGGEHLYLSFEVTNNHSSEICLEFDGATLANSGDATINEIEVEVMGDLYYGERASRFRFSTDCIASGATRFVWGNRLASYDKLEAGGIPAIDHVNISYQITEPETVDYSGVPAELIPLLPQRPEAYYPAALVPTESRWTSSSRSIQGAVYHDFENSAAFLNMTEQSVTVDFKSSAFIYMDENDYIVYTASATLGDFLGIDDDDLTPENYRLEAMGGTTGFAETYRNILPTFGNPSIVGRATRLFMALELCHGLDIGTSCDVRN